MLPSAIMHVTRQLDAPRGKKTPRISALGLPDETHHKNDLTHINGRSIPPNIPSPPSSFLQYRSYSWSTLLRPSSGDPHCHP
ncbi:hypothetical protein TIFTF001_013050 [Ficus carica]|uniref:Uncharacterized protein n=1 Tax=Ficus carica TaxID=3494 RepID=A0AA88A3H3_FICCA|nr:hypothetical protein TIFTF001_013050 [Ficus carica]